MPPPLCPVEHGAPDALAAFRVTQAGERLRLLRELRDDAVAVVLNAADAATVPTTLWSVDVAQQRLGLSLVGDADTPKLARLIEADEAVAVAYLDSVKLQFDLRGFVLVRGARSCTLQCALPQAVYRFQRRNAFRVRPPARCEPLARMRHPALPDMTLALRILDLSIGGCALWLPADVPPLQAGTRLGEVQVQLDADHRFAAPATLQHVSSLGDAELGERLGCEWAPLPGAAERVLQRWIDRAQQRSRLLAKG